MILSDGTLGILIPPSILAILFAVVTQQSVGELFLGCLLPGLLLSGLYVLYVTVRCYINPELGPALPVEERVSLIEKLRLLRGVISPVLLIVLVLGVIRSEEHTSELQSLMRISYAVFCLKKKIYT